MSLSVANIIAIAKTSQYIAQNDIAKGSLFGARKIPIAPQVLRIEREIIEYIYNLDPTNSTLTLTSNYLYSLCRGYNLQAQYIINAGGSGGISPIIPSTPPTPYDFNVDSNSFIATGATSKVFPSSWIGWNILFIRSDTPQSSVPSSTTVYYSWDKTTATLNLFGPAPFNGAAQDTENFQIYPI